MTVVNALAAAVTPQVHRDGQRKYPNFFPLVEMPVVACDPRWWGSREQGHCSRGRPSIKKRNYDGIKRRRRREREWH